MDKKERIRGAIWGQLIGDAVALGAHWIYDAEKMKQEFPEIKGFETPKPGHYHAGKVSGDPTHYGEGCRIMLQSIAERKKFGVKDFSKRFKGIFGSPFYTGYLDHATRETLKNMENGVSPSGADDDEMATASRLAPLVAFYSHSPDLEQKVQEATVIGQNNPKAIGYMQANARILASLLHGKSLRESFEKESKDPIASASIQAALSIKSLHPLETLRKFGLTCHLNETFPGCVFLALHCEGSFEKPLLTNVQAGGDSAGRGSMLGAWLGAHLGIQAIPKSWLLQLRGREYIAYWVDELVGALKL